MAKDASKDNLFIYILKFPFILIIGLFKYASLGCYYVSYILLYPFIFTFRKLGDAIFNIYKKKDKSKDLSNLVKEEAVNLDSGNQEFQAKPEETVSEEKQESAFQKFYNNLYIIRKQREIDEAKNQNLITALQTDTERSEKPLTFKYTALDSDGKRVTNTFFAYSKMEVYTYLTNEGYKVLTIDTSKWIEFAYGPTSFGSYKFKNKDLIFWLTQLSTYIKSGIPLTDSMRILGKQMSKSMRKKRVFDSIIYNLTLGEAFSTALEKQNKSFPALLISMIKTAEATGELESTLDDMANYYTDIENTRKAMISAMTYPAIITVFANAVIAFILIYVIPQFEKVYAQAGATLNSFTQFIIVASRFLNTNLLQLLLIIAVIITFIVILYKKVKSFREALQSFAMHLPIFGKIIIYKEMNIFAKTFSSLLKNNVFITDSMNLLSSITNNEIYKKIMFKTINNIAKGDKISSAFKNQWAVPDVAYYMIVTGESTGELATMMGKVADYYQTEHKTVVNSMKAFIEPAMIIFLAVVVGGIIMAVILPMFQLYSQIS